MTLYLLVLLDKTIRNGVKLKEKSSYFYLLLVPQLCIQSAQICHIEPMWGPVRYTVKIRGLVLGKNMKIFLLTLHYFLLFYLIVLINTRSGPFSEFKSDIY